VRAFFIANRSGQAKIYLSDVAMTRHNLANLQKAINDYAGAEISYQDELKIRRKLARTNPTIYSA